MPTPTAEKIPVTVLTGYLGAGKTTLLNRILSEPHGRKYAVIVNEFGEIGIDGDLIVNADEEIFETNNGCICCTVRGDLIRIIGGLMKRGRTFDGILVETTGLADPGPVAQTFFTDDQVAARTRLDGIVTVVDARHLPRRLADSREAEEQIAFADMILLNKTDLVSKEELSAIEAKIRAINPFAKIRHTERCQIPIAELLDQRGFDLERILQREPDFLKAEEHHHHHGDDSHGHDHGHEHHHDHQHDSSVTSVCLTADTPLDPQKFDSWFQDLLASRGQDLLRYKGILAFAGSDKRTVLQGVHMTMEANIFGAWKPDEPRTSRLVLIGRKLDPAELRQKLAACQ